MKVDLNTVKWFLDFELPPVNELVEKIGAQLGAVDDVIDIGSKYKEVVIVKVAQCEPHPNADKLHVCKIDDNGAAKAVKRDEHGYVQVVCGAPNCREGMLAVWLPPGATVPSTFGKEPFVLEARELRGVVSNGMLASPKELAFGDNHDGLLEIEGDLKPGDDFAKAFGLKDDFVIDIENKMFTHRPDCFGFLGIARELAGIHQKPFKSPDWYIVNPQFPDIEAEELALKVENELPDLVPRFTAIALRNVAVGPSPVWLSAYLARTGQKSVNNIVDYTNWYMFETGQPIHVYDYDKVKALSGDNGVTLVVRNPKPGEKIKLLNGKEIEPRPDAMMVATDQHLICVGGAIGGTNTEVDENTKNIIIEAANWDMFNMRRTAMEHGIFTDAVTRFTKGQSPLQNLAVLARIVDEVRQHAGGKVASGVVDNNHLSDAVKTRASLHPPVKISVTFVNERLGLKLSAAEIKKLLSNVEFEVSHEGNELNIKAPFWRTDIELREDVVEEVGRLYGYDHLPLKLPQRDLTPALKDPLLELKAQIRARLAKAGANEVLTYSFVHGDLLARVGQDKAQAFQLSNALSPDLQYYRMSLIPSLLERIHPNVKTGYNEFALFELGRTHGADNGLDEDDLPREFEFTAFVVAAADKLKKPGAAYYEARKYLTELVGAPLEFKPVDESSLKFAVTKPYDPKRSAMVSVKGGRYLGIIGEFKPSVAQALKLPKYCAGFEIDTTALLDVLGGTNYKDLSRFPKVSQDITLKLPVEVSHQDLIDFFWHAYQAENPKKVESTLSTVAIYKPEANSGTKNVTLHFTIASYERTLTDAEVNKLLEAVAAAAKDKFGAERI